MSSYSPICSTNRLASFWPNKVASHQLWLVWTYWVTPPLDEAMQMGQKMQQHFKSRKKRTGQKLFRKCLSPQYANLLSLNVSWRSTRLLKLSTLKLLKLLKQWELQAGMYLLAVNWFKLSRFCLLCYEDQSYYYSNLSFQFHPSGGHCGKVINFCAGDFKSFMPFCVCRKKSICSFSSWAYLCFSHFLSL